MSNKNTIYCKNHLDGIDNRCNLMKDINNRMGIKRLKRRKKPPAIAATGGFLNEYLDVYKTFKPALSSRSL